MMSEASPTRALLDHAAGDRSSAATLIPQVYDKLRALAGRYMKDERSDHTLQPTALVHEAYIRLIDITRVDWKGQTHFYAMAARQMRRALVDHARAAQAEKRGRRMKRVTLDERSAISADPSEFLALDEALTRLHRRSERQAEVAQLRLFAGMRVREIAFVLDVSERTVKGDWRVARAWLLRELGDDRRG